MARKPGTRNAGEFALFDVVYEDGSQRSNRRVPMAVLGGLDGDEPARAPPSASRTAKSRKNPASRRCASRRCGAPPGNSGAYFGARSSTALPS